MTSGSDSQRMLGRYQLLFTLGQGGMGEVHLAKLSGAAGFEKLCIVKTILPQMQSDPQFVDRFHHEARVLVHLTHSSIAQVYDMGDVDGTLYMAIEYVPGVDLARVQSRVHRSGAVMPVPIALYVGQRVAEALGYAHRKTGPDGAPLGIVHRDVSPQNIMVSYEGEVKVIDFGLAKSAVRSKHTLPSTVMGKLGYMSPEQAMALPLDQRSDIYSAGVVVWEMLAGRPLFEGGTMAEMMVKMAQPQIPSLRAIRPDISPTLDQVVMRALAVDPAARYARADDFGRALNELAVREQLTVGAEEVGNYVRAMCPEEFAAERALQSKLSILRRRGSGAASPAPESPELDGTLLRPSSTGSKPAELTLAQRALSVAEPAPRQATPSPQQNRPAPSSPSVARGRSGSVEAGDANELPSSPIAVPRSKAPWVVVGVMGVAAVGVFAAAFLKGQAQEASPEPVAQKSEVAASPVVDAGAPVAEVKPVEPEPAAKSGASEADPQPVGTVAVEGTVFQVTKNDDKLFVLVKDGKALKKGDQLDLIGDPAGQKTAPLFGEGVVLEVVGGMATIGVYDEPRLPARLFAIKDVTHAASGTHRTVGTPKKVAVAAATPKVATPAAKTTKPEEPMAPSTKRDDSVDSAKTVSTKVEPTKMEPARQEPASVDPAKTAMAPQQPLRQVTGSVQLTGPKGSGVARVRNSSAFGITGCKLRLPGALIYRFSKAIDPGGAVDVPILSFSADRNPPDPQFANGWAPIYCTEGTGYLRIEDRRH
jgi:serine/threonine protein kinase